nr:hypothetical protein Iba_chr09dCG0020 [Ipomoea batatas]
MNTGLELLGNRLILFQNVSTIVWAHTTGVAQARHHGHWRLMLEYTNERHATVLGTEILGINFLSCSSPFCSDYGRHSQPPSLDKNAFTKHVFRYVAIVLRTVIAIWSPQGVAPAHHHWGSR